MSRIVQRRFLYVALVMGGLFLTMACEKDEEPRPVPGVCIGGIYKEIELARITVDSTRLNILFLMDGVTLEIHTADTIASRYFFYPGTFKSAPGSKSTSRIVIPAKLFCTLEGDTFISTSGKLDLEKDGRSYSGTFDSMVQYGIIRIAITEGAFRDVEAVSGVPENP